MSRVLHGAWAGSLVCVLALTGCPNQGATTSEVGALKIDFDASAATKVGSELQLHLQFTGNPPQQLMGAMIKGETATTTWHADPADAVSFDLETSKVTFKKRGHLKIWATFPRNGKMLKSNVVNLDVKEISDAAPVESQAPLSKGGKRPSKR